MIRQLPEELPEEDQRQTTTLKVYETFWLPT